MTTFIRRARIIGAILLTGVLFVLGATGCGGSNRNPGTIDVADAGVAGGSGGPLYVTAVRIFTGDSSTGYMVSMPSLDVGTPVDLRRAIEMDDAWVFGAGDPYFYTATIFAPTIKRWSLSATGDIVPGPTMSLANQGVMGTYTAAATPLFSKRKAYFVDSASAQVVVWNPSDMTLIRTIPIDIPVVDGMEADLELVVRSDRIFVTIFWASAASKWTQFGNHTRLVTIDPATDQIIATNDETRCETLSPAGMTADGTAYFTPWDYHAAVRSVFGPGFGAFSCAMRVVPAGNSFDDGYQVDLSSLVGGRPAGSMQIIANGDALIHVWHSELVSATPANWIDSRFLPGYKWHRWHPGDTTAPELPNQMAGTEGSPWTVVDGRTYSFAPNADYSETTLFELGEGGELTQKLTVPGWTVGAIRVR